VTKGIVAIDVAPSAKTVGRGRLTRGVVTARRAVPAASPASRAVRTAPSTRTAVAQMTRAVSGIDRRIESPFGTHELSGGRGRESISRWMIRSMLSSGNIPHLRAHARFRLRERRADRARLDSEVPRDLAVVETEIELSDHHRPLALCQPREQPPHFHPVQRGFDLVLRHTRSGVVEAKQRSPEAAPAGTHRDDEEPAGEVIVLGGRPTKARDERVVKGAA